jgi:hypothetical protein
MTTTEAGACVACGRLTKDRYFASASGAQVGSRRPPLPVSLCRTCPPGAAAAAADMASAAAVEVHERREDASRDAV